MAACVLNTTVTTSEGIYAGTLRDGILSWKGIPYAQPPVGKLRWRPPQNPKEFSGIRKAEEFGPICPQKGYEPSSIYTIPNLEQSEDCLSLNIWSKRDTLSHKKAVFVFIHEDRVHLLLLILISTYLFYLINEWYLI